MQADDAAAALDALADKPAEIHGVEIKEGLVLGIPITGTFKDAEMQSKLLQAFRRERGRWPITPYTHTGNSLHTPVIGHVKTIRRVQAHPSHLAADVVVNEITRGMYDKVFLSLVYTEYRGEFRVGSGYFWNSVTRLFFDASAGTLAIGSGGTITSFGDIQIGTSNNTVPLGDFTLESTP